MELPIEFHYDICCILAKSNSNCFSIEKCRLFQDTNERHIKKYLSYMQSVNVTLL